MTRSQENHWQARLEIRVAQNGEPCVCGAAGGDGKAVEFCFPGTQMFF